MHFTFTSCYIRVVFVYRRIQSCWLCVVCVYTSCCMVEWLHNLTFFVKSTRSGSQPLLVQSCRLRALHSSCNFMYTSYTRRVIYVLASYIYVLNRFGFVWCTCWLRVVWLTGYKTSFLTRSEHVVEVSNFV